MLLLSNPMKKKIKKKGRVTMVSYPWLQLETEIKHRARKQDIVQLGHHGACKALLCL